MQSTSAEWQDSEQRAAGNAEIQRRQSDGDETAREPVAESGPLPDARMSVRDVLDDISTRLALNQNGPEVAGSRIDMALREAGIDREALAMMVEEKQIGLRAAERAGKGTSKADQQAIEDRERMRQIRDWWQRRASIGHSILTESASRTRIAYQDRCGEVHDRGAESSKLKAEN